jgi:hypothetical protein
MHAAGMRKLFLWAPIALAIACGGGGGGGTDSGIDAARSDSGSPEIDSGPTDDAGMVADSGAPAEDAGTPDDDAGAIQDAGPAGPLGIAITGVEFWANCMPGIGGGSRGDPNGSITLTVDNGGSDTPIAYTIVSATLTLTGPSTLMQTLTLDPSSGTFPPGSSVITLNKAAGEPRLSACGEACSSEITVSVVIELAGGERRTLSNGDGTFGCAF